MAAPDTNQTPQQVRGSGFTLLELTVVLAVIAGLLGTLIAIFSASLEDASYTATQNKLAKLQQVIGDYRIAYNRLPCPANSSAYATSAANFGIEAATTGNCAGGSPAADIADATAAVGMVPVRTLGLPDDMAVDGWGRRIRYAVAPAFVVSDAFDGIAPTDTTARITVSNNDSSAALATTAAYVLVSYGKNGHGGRGGATGTLVNSGITNTSELLNCKCTASGALNGSADLDSFMQGDVKPDPADALNNFDDLVAFATRVQLRDADE
ncbi:MAG: type II secretion system protein [Alphaproteobacteria bacterium]|nr:type II secretion system protein [Alphaproteobacteria bacterium]